MLSLFSVTVLAGLDIACRRAKIWIDGPVGRPEQSVNLRAAGWLHPPQDMEKNGLNGKEGRYILLLGVLSLLEMLGYLD